jgi:hypothetical protein
VDTSPVLLAQLGRGLLYGAAFAVPLLLLIALLLIGNGRDRHTSFLTSVPPTPSASPSTTVAGDWPAEVVFVAHTLPALIHDELTAAVPRRGYQFSGAAREIWEITVEPLPGSLLQPQVSLYGPAGDLLAAGAALTAVLPQDGDYRLMVEARADGAATGSYRLSVLPR